MGELKQELHEKKPPDVMGNIFPPGELQVRDIFLLISSGAYIQLHCFGGQQLQDDLVS